MHKQVSDYLNSLCAPVRSRDTRSTLRTEFSGHIGNIVEELTGKGMSEEEAVAKAVERMGNPTEIGLQIASMESSGTNAAAVSIGFLSLIAAFVFLGPSFPLAYMLDFRALVFVVTVTVSLVLLGGTNRFTRRTTLNRARISALYAGIIGTIIGAITSLGNLGDYEALGPSLAFCVTSLLYGVIASALAWSLAHLNRPIEAYEIGKFLED